MRKKQYILSGNFPIGNFENIYLHRVNKYKDFFKTTFYESNQDLNWIIRDFFNAKDLETRKGSLELSFYDDFIKTKTEQFYNVFPCNIIIDYLDLDFDSMIIEIDWHYDIKVTRK